MEIVTSNNIKQFDNNKINAIYGDILDLDSLGIDVKGITYNDVWKVSKFFKYKKNKDRVDSIFSYLNINNDLLNIKICDLSHSEFKWILLAYILLVNKNIIIFDHFDVGLTYKEQKKLINVIKSLNKDGKKIMVFSKDLVFLNRITNYLFVFKNNKIVYEGVLIDVFNKKILEEPEIIKFIKLVNKKNIDINLTLDNNELLKNIYRSLE